MSLEATFFEDGWVPSEQDVVIGRLKMATTHSGNLRLHQITLSYLEEYMSSSDEKTRKSQILAEIYDQIQRVNNGKFVKLDAKTKKWYEVTKSVARERISQGLRDNLKDQYKSSLAHKRKRWLMKNGVLAADDPTLQIIPTVPTSHTVDKKGNKRPKVSALHMQYNSVDMSNAEQAGHPTAEIAASEGLGDGKVGIKALKLNAGQSEAPKSKLDTNNGTSGNSISSEPFLPKDGIRLLDEGFEPEKNDVFVGLRKRSTSHPGIIQLVEAVERFKEEYKKCGNNKLKKAHVLSQVANALTTEQDPPARFLRWESKHQRWYEVEAFYAREKISQTFRDILQDGYRSASTYKKLKRRKSCTGNQSNSSIIPEDKADSDSAAADDGEESSEELRAGKRLPPQEAATTKIAAGSPDLQGGTVKELTGKGNPSNGTIKLPVPPTHLSKKRQLEWQIRELTKQLEELQEGDKGTGSGEISSATLDVTDSCAKEECNTGIQHDRASDTCHAVRIDPGVANLTDSGGEQVVPSGRKWVKPDGPENDANGVAVGRGLPDTLRNESMAVDSLHDGLHDDADQGLVTGQDSVKVLAEDEDDENTEVLPI